MASLGAFGYELDLTKISGEEKQAIEKQIAEYKSIEELVLRGDLYRTLNPFESNYFCETLVSKDKRSAYVAGERIFGDPLDHNRVVKLRGLDANRMYRVEELGIEISGRALENVGVLLPRTDDFCGWTWHIKSVSNE